MKNSRNIWTATRTAAWTTLTGIFTLLLVGQAAFSETRAAPVPPTSGAPAAPNGGVGPTATSSYIFRYATGMSKVLMDTLTFTDTQPLKLNECETTEKTNGPIACTTNCQGVPLCLLVFEGPPGLKPSDVLEKLKEKPVIHTTENSGTNPSAPSGPNAIPSTNSESLRSERIEIYRQN